MRESSEVVPWLVAFVGYVTSNKVICMETSVQVPLFGSGTCLVPRGDERAASGFEGRWVCVVACWAGLCRAAPGNAHVWRACHGRGIQGPGERSALLLGREEVVLVLRTSQTVSAAVGLVS